MATILYMSNASQSIAILASEVKAIIRRPAYQSVDIERVLPAATRIQYGTSGSVTMEISDEEHEAIVTAWRGACGGARGPDGALPMLPRPW
mgnify:CR=1 FL=1